MKNHVILSTGLHCITDNSGHVKVYTEKEYEHLCWWTFVKNKMFK